MAKVNGTLFRVRAEGSVIGSPEKEPDALRMPPAASDSSHPALSSVVVFGSSCSIVISQVLVLPITLPSALTLNKVPFTFAISVFVYDSYNKNLMRIVRV